MQRDSLRMIVDSGHLLQVVVDDVLDYSKLEAGMFEVDVKDGCINSGDSGRSSQQNPRKRREREHLSRVLHHG